jgi:purine-nucleoside phosphorylase
MSSSPAFASLAKAAAQSRPCLAVVLGSGMGAIARRIEPIATVPFAEVPDLAVPSVAGHGGTLTLGNWAGSRVLVFEGRVHYYEGQPWRTVTAPVRAAAFLGARALLCTNAAGGIHDALGPGSVMAIRDHFTWTRPLCWRQKVERTSPYSPRLLDLLTHAADDLGLSLRAGVYAAVTGPCYETPAEVRALRAWGADAVGMSTAAEIEAGGELGLECAALSLITNRAAGLGHGPIDHEEVLTTAAAQIERLGSLLEVFVRGLG